MKNPVNSPDERIDACQLEGVIRSTPRAGWNDEKGLSYVVRAKRVLKRMLSVKTEKKIKNTIGTVLDVVDRRRGGAKASKPFPRLPSPNGLEAGDLVRVRPCEEIELTLDRWGALKGCAFLKEMAGYCGTTHRVLKRVERFIDERDYRMKKASGVVLLEGLMCPGTGTTGRCDRSCFFFWREEWLEKIDGPAPGPEASGPGPVGSKEF